MDRCLPKSRDTKRMSNKTTNKRSRGRTVHHIMEHCVVVVAVPPSASSVESKVPTVAQLAKCMREQHRSRGPSGLARFVGVQPSVQKVSSVAAPPPPPPPSDVAQMAGVLRRLHRPR